MRVSLIGLIAGVVFVLSIVSASAQPAQTPALDGFWGLKFGSSATESRKFIESKHTGTIDEKETNADVLTLMAPDFAGKTPTAMIFQFERDKFHTGIVFYTPTDDSKVLDLYSGLRSDLIDKYGKPANDLRVFEKPYSDGDGDETEAIKHGLATVAVMWLFDRADGLKNSITLEIRPSLAIALTYQDGKLIKEAVDAQKAKTIKDY